MLNHCAFMGRLTADPELKQTGSGVDVCSFTIAVDRDFKQGDEKVADFIPVTCWRGTAKFVSQYFQKGRLAVVTGSLQTRKYEDKDGKKRTAFEIQAQNVYFGDSKRDASAQTAPSGTASAAAAEDFAEISDSDGDLPF